MAKYNVHHPEHYPIAWLSAAKLAAEHCEGEGYWVSVDWARGESGAVARMKRLRAFRDGLRQAQHNYPKIREVMAKGYALSFRKVFAHGVWDVQLAWRPSGNVGELLESFSADGGEELAKDY